MNKTIGEDLAAALDAERTPEDEAASTEAAYRKLNDAIDAMLRGEPLPPRDPGWEPPRPGGTRAKLLASIQREIEQEEAESEEANDEKQDDDEIP